MTIRKDAHYWALIESQEVNGPAWAQAVKKKAAKKKKATKKKAKKNKRRC